MPNSASSGSVMSPRPCVRPGQRAHHGGRGDQQHVPPVVHAPDYAVVCRRSRSRRWPTTSISRRDLFARSRDVGGLAAFAALLGSRAEAEWSLPRRSRRRRRSTRRVHIHRRPTLHQRAGHLHDPQRLDDAAGSPRGDGPGRAAVRPSGRVDRSHRRAPGDADQRRVGAGDLGLRGSADARDGGLRRRRQPRSARPHPGPARLCQRRSRHPEALAQRLRRRDSRRRRARGGGHRRSRSSKRPWDRAPRWCTSWPGPQPTAAS